MEIPGFQIIEQLGEGPMSTVWKANQVSLNRIVAVKVLKQKFPGGSDGVHPVLKEARVVAALKHPNLIPLFDAGEIDGTFYFVMEYIAGKTVGQLIKEKGAVSRQSSLNAALLVADALEHAWKTASIVHRGINPDNIMIDAEGNVKLADLGSAKVADPANLAAMVKAGAVHGKLNYISPEQAKCSIRIDFRTDMYGLGATLYHMVTGVMPFKDLEPKEVLTRQLSGFLENPRDISANVSLGMDQLITRLMMKEYKARYASWADVQEDIRQAMAGRAHAPKAPDPATDGKPALVSTILEAKAPKSKKAAIDVSGAAAAAGGVPKIKKPPMTFTFTETMKVATHKKAPRPRLKIPWYVQVPAWTLMTVWWAFLAWSELTVLPPHPKKPDVQQPSPSQTAAPAQPAVPDQPFVPDQTQPPPPEAPAQQAPLPSQPPPEPAVPEYPDEEVMMTLRETVAGRLAAGEMDKAAAVVKEEFQNFHSKKYVADLKALSALLVDAGKVVECFFTDKIGQDIKINDKGQERKVAVRSVKNYVVTAEYEDDTGPTPVATPVIIPFVNLDPAMLARCIGQEDTAAKSIMNFVMCMKTQDYDSARKSAVRCGPLSDALTKAVDARFRDSGN